MSLSGLFQTLTDKYISKSNLLTAYDFLESGAVINKAPNYLNTFSGVLSGSNNFYYGSGTGLATQHIVSISGTGFYSSNFSHFFTIQKSGQSFNLFSSLANESGAVNSGYFIGTNSLGKLVFSYSSCAGPQSVTAPFSLHNNSNLAVVKSDNFVSFYQYTPVSNILQSSSFQVIGNEIFPSDYADLFYGNHLPSSFTKTYYSGFVNDYLYFNVPLSSSQIVTVFSGLYNEVVSTPATSSALIDECTGIFSLPQATVITTSGNPPPSIALTKSAIVLLCPLPSGSKVLVDYDINVSNVSWNNSAKYDTNTQNFVITPFNTILPIVYFNGQRVISGTTSITGQFCTTGKVWQFDYNYLNNKQIDDADSYSAIDTVVYDLPNRNTWQYLSSGTGSVSINNGSGFAVYLNGQRTLDFSGSGSILIPNWTPHTTDIICIDYYQSGYSVLGEVYNAGYFYTSGAFIQNTSRVYENGIRLLLGTDYLEITSGSLLQAAPLEKPLTTVVDITDYNYWNI